MIKRKKKSEEIKTKDLLDYINQSRFFQSIWREKPHFCESCDIYLGREPKSYFFDHLLPKAKYPQFAGEKRNIFLCCFDCHTKKTQGFPTKKHKEAIDEAKELFNNI